MKRVFGYLLGIFAVIALSSTSHALTSNEVHSGHIAEADGSSGQATNSGQGVKRGHIQDNAISKEKLADNAVSSAEIENGTVGEDDLATGAVSSVKILNGTILEEDIANGAVTEDKLSAEYKAVVDALEDRIAALELLLEHFSASESGDDVYITGANLHVRSGSGATDGTVNGLGNVIIGYNEDPTYFTEDRTGSHNLIIGEGNNYSAYGGIAATPHGILGAAYASAIGGEHNTVSAEGSVIIGGRQNVAESDGYYSVIISGYADYVSNQETVAIGGGDLYVDGFRAVAAGGLANQASENYEFIGGGSGQ